MSHRDARDRIQRWVKLPRPVDEVWAVIGDFGSIAGWHPDVTSAEVFEIEGEIHRHLRIGEGGVTLERLIEAGPHHLTYEIIDSPLPVVDFRATLSCVAEDGGCHVFWSAMYEPTDPTADEIVTAFYEEGLRALRERFGG